MKVQLKKNYKFSVYSIKSKIAMLCTVFILISTMVTFIYLFQASKSVITDSTELIMQELAKSYGSNLSSAVDQISQSANFMMGSASISDYVQSGGSEYEDEIRELAAMYLGTNSYSEDISIVDENGIVLYSSDNNLTGNDLSGEAYYSDMVSTGLSTQSDIFISENSGEACVNFAIPLRSDMQVIGFHDMPDGTEAIPDGTMPAEGGAAAVNPDMGNSYVSGDDTAVQTPPADTAGMPVRSEQNAPVTEYTGAIVLSVKASWLASILSDATVGNYKSGHVFILDSNGALLYHPNSDIIGASLKVGEITDIVSRLKEGDISRSGIVTYDYEGNAIYAAFTAASDNGWILFTAADQAEVLASLNVVATGTILIVVFLAAVLVSLSLVITGNITNSIHKITQLIHRTAELDFTEDESQKRLLLRKDETGEMARAITRMRGSLKDILLHISEVSNEITASSNNLNTISYSVNDHASDNSATVEELSAGMQETSATTEQIRSSIEQISLNSKDITDKAEASARLSKDIIARTAELKTSTLTATQTTRKIYEEVKAKTDAAIEQAKAVEKIHMLTNIIRDIAGQTNLLALNASIEAARAGEAGRGFSVVAAEIGNLANQSGRTVAHITDTVDEVYKAVGNMTKSLQQTLDFLGDKVIEDYKTFMGDSEKYNEDAGFMSRAMMNIQTQIDLLNTNVHGITDSITEINLMISEAASGVTDVAEKNTNIVALTGRTQSMANENTAYANSLREIVERFKL